MDEKLKAYLMIALMFFIIWGLLILIVGILTLNISPWALMLVSALITAIWTGILINRA